MGPDVQGRVVVTCIFSSDDVDAELQIFLFSERDFLFAGVMWAFRACQEMKIDKYNYGKCVFYCLYT